MKKKAAQRKSKPSAPEDDAVAALLTPLRKLNPTRFNAQTIAEVRAVLGAAFYELSQRAWERNQEATAAYVDAVTQAIRGFTLLDNDVAGLRSVARKSTVWPVLLGADKGAADDAAKRVRKLGVSEGSIYKPAKKAGTSLTPANFIVKSNLEFVVSRRQELLSTPKAYRPTALFRWEARAVELGDFVPSAALDYFEVMWAKIMDNNCGRPELNSRLRPLGQNRGRRLQGGGQRTKESNIRDGIKKALLAAFERKFKVSPRKTT